MGIVMKFLDDQEQFKLDKQVEYFKYISTAHIAVIGFLLSQGDKLGLEKLPDVVLFGSAILLILSLLVSLYGYVTLIDSLFESKKHHEKLITSCRLIAGVSLVAIIFATLLQVVSIQSAV